jgi:flagellar biosynthetic protein FliO
MINEYFFAGGHLLLVLILILGVAFVFKKALLKKSLVNSLIEVVYQQSIGPKERLLIIKIHKELFLIGATTTQISKLHTFPESEEISNLIKEKNTTFQLDNLLSIFKKPKMETL